MLASGTAVDVHAVYESRRLSPRQWIASGARLDTDSGGTRCDLTYLRAVPRTEEGQVTTRQVASEAPSSAVERGGGRHGRGSPSRALGTRPPSPGREVTQRFSAPPRRRPRPGSRARDRESTHLRRWLDASPPAQFVTASADAGGLRVLRARQGPDGAQRDRLPRGHLALNRRGGLAAVPAPAAAGSGRFLTAVGLLRTSAPRSSLTSAPSGAGWHELAIQSGMGTGANVTTYGYRL